MNAVYVERKAQAYEIRSKRPVIPTTIKETGRILNHVSVSLDSKDRLGLAAPSGFGKTTFCKILAGYDSRMKVRFC